MHKETRTITVNPESELALVLRDAVARGVDVVVDTGEVRYPLHPAPTRPTKPTARRRARRTGSTDPLWDIIGLGADADHGDGITDVSSNKHTYLAEAYDVTKP